MPIKTTQVQGGVNVRHIWGSGGGGKSSSSSNSVAADDPNTLRSTARAKILFCLGEGAVEGFIGGDLSKSVRIDGTPLISPNGNVNFKGFSLDWRSGTPDQSYIPGFQKASVEEPVGQTVKASLPVTRTIFDPTADAARVRIRLPALRDFTGDAGKKTTTQYFIEYAPAGSAYRRVVDQSITGKADSQYERSHEFKLDGSAPWDIRVVRALPDSDNVRLENSIIFQALTTVQYEQQRYPNTVLLAVDIDAEQFSGSSIPAITVLMRGIRVLVPHNYNPYSRTYTGPFNGSLVPAWTNNPVWILYDLLTDARYGAGVSPSFIDVYDFYVASLHCDNSVPNGEGGTEPRWVFNATIDSREEAYKVCEAIASSFNGKMEPRGSRIGLIVDQFQKPVRNYGHHNVEIKRDKNGAATSDPFVYKTISSSAIDTVAVVSYREPNQNYETRQIYVRDEDGIAKFGYKPVDLTAFGCTSRTQAKRYGLWKLYTDRIQSRVVVFRVASEGLLVDVGEVIGITDRTLTGLRLSGRIAQATSSLAVIDEPVTFSTNNVYTLLTSGLDGKLQENLVDLSMTAINTPTTDLFLVQPFTATPPEESSWGLRTSRIAPQQFKVTAVTESDDGGYEIEAIQYAPQKYDAIDNGVSLEPIRTTSLIDPLAPPAPVESLVARESLQAKDNGDLFYSLDLGWSYPESGYLQLSYFEIEYQIENDAVWTKGGTTRLRSYSLKDLPLGGYILRVTAVNQFGVRGVPATVLTNRRLDLKDPPQAVQNLRIAKTEGRSIVLRWDYVEELDVRKGGFHIVKHSPKLVNVTWKDGSEVARLPGYRSEVVLPFQAGTYQIRTFDSSGSASEISAQVTTVFALRDPINVIKILQDSPEFFGRQDRVIVDNGNRLTLSGSDRIDSIPEPFDAFPGPLDSYGSNTTTEYATEGYYYLSDQVRMGAVFPAYIYSVLGASVFARSDSLDLQPGPFDALPPTYFDSPEEENPNFTGSPSVTLQISLSQDGQVYSDWLDFTPGEYLFQNAQFRVRFETKDAGLTSQLNELQIIVDVPDRSESGRVTTSEAQPTTVVYAAAFFESPRPQATVLNQIEGDRLSVVSESNRTLVFEILNGKAAWLAMLFGQFVDMVKECNQSPS